MTTDSTIGRCTDVVICVCVFLPAFRCDSQYDLSSELHTHTDIKHTHTHTLSPSGPHTVPNRPILPRILPFFPPSFSACIGIYEARVCLLMILVHEGVGEFAVLAAVLSVCLSSAL